jgi:hypothetical protein
MRPPLLELSVLSNTQTFLQSVQSKQRLVLLRL